MCKLVEGVQYERYCVQFEFPANFTLIHCSSEYRKHYQAMKGDRLPPTWLANFEKVTIDGAKR